MDMKTLNFKLIALLFVLSVFAFSSCDKPDPDAQSAEDDARGAYILSDAFALGNNEAGGGSGGKADIPECMTIVRNTDTKTITITFNNCLYRGATRNGIIHISYTVPNPDHPRAVSVTITFEDYKIDNVDVEGTISSTFGGSYTQPVIHVVSDNMVATFADGKTISWSSDQTFTITEGFGDGEIDNNVIVIGGTAEGINRKGMAYESVYSSVTVDRSCEYGYPVSGTVTITSDKGTSVIDYGNGTCDNEIEVTNSGVTVTISLN